MDCTALQYVSGHEHVLSLLKRSIPEICLRVKYLSDQKQFQKDLLRVLQLGDVKKLSLESDKETSHQCLADAVIQANATLLPRHGVHQVELLSSSPVEDYKKIVAHLFSAQHVTDITLPDPNWIPQSYLKYAIHKRNEHWLRSLQSLTFNTRDSLDGEGPEGATTNDMLDWLEPILQRNKQLALLATKGVAGAFTQFMSEQLLPGNRNAGVTIDPLMTYLDEAFANTPTGRALPVLNKRIAAGGRREWLELHGLKIPTPDTLGTSALFKFIDGTTLSRKDSLDLSKWLEEAGGQKLRSARCHAEKRTSSFVPTLNLMFSWDSKEVIDLLEQASASSMTFGVSVTEDLSVPVAQKLYDVMASQPSRVTSFDDATVWRSRTSDASDASDIAAVRALLRNCIKACTAAAIREWIFRVCCHCLSAASPKSGCVAGGTAAKSNSRQTSFAFCAWAM